MDIYIITKVRHSFNYSNHFFLVRDILKLITFGRFERDSRSWNCEAVLIPIFSFYDCPILDYHF